MSRLLIAIAAALLIGAALTSPSEAQGSWTCTYAFANGQQGWAANTASNYYNANWSGSSWTHYDSYFPGPADYRRGLDIGLSVSSTTLTSVSATISYTAGTNVYGNGSNAGFIQSNGSNLTSWSVPTYPTNPISWSGTASGTTSIRIGLPTSMASSASYSGSVSISSITLSGTGTQPSNCGTPPTPTPVPPTATHTPIPATATATLVPTATNTPIAYPTGAPFVGGQGDSYWGNTYNMAYGLQGWSLISGMIGAGRVVSADVSGTQRLEMSYPLTNVRLNDLLVNYTSNGCMHTFEVRDGNTVFEAGTVGSGPQLIDWQGDHVMVNGTLVIALIGRPGCSVSSFELTEIFISGYGTNPTNLQATAVAFNTGNIWGGLQDANTMLNTLPQSFAGSVPPETGRALFGYVKWIVSPSSADEIAGPFAPVISHIGFALLIMFGAAAVYAIVWALVWILKFVIWLFKWVLTLVDLVLQIAQVIGNAIGGLLKFI